MLEAFAATLNVGISSMSVESSFFELGGNSLRAVSLARRLSSLLGRSVSVADVMLTTQASSLATCADEHGNHAGERLSISAGTRLLTLLRWLVPADTALLRSGDMLVCIHDFTGQLWAFREIVHELSLACLGCVCTHEVSAHCSSILQLSQRYFEQLIAAVGPGIIRLVAYSAGCQIGCCVAQLATAYGVSVNVALLDGLVQLITPAQVPSEESDVDGIVSVLFKGAVQRSESREAKGDALPHRVRLESVFSRLGALLGRSGVMIAEAILRMASYAPCSVGGTFNQTLVYLRTRGNELQVPIRCTYCIDGGHFDCMLSSQMFLSARILNHILARSD